MDRDFDVYPAADVADGNSNTVQNIEPRELSAKVDAALSDATYLDSLRQNSL